MRKTKKYLLQSMQRAYDALYYDDWDKRYDLWDFKGRFDVNEHQPMLKTKTQHRYVLRRNPEIRAVEEFDIRGRSRGFRIFNTGYDTNLDWALRKINRHL